MLQNSVNAHELFECFEGNFAVIGYAQLCVTFDERLRSGRNSGGPALAIALNGLKRLQNSLLVLMNSSNSGVRGNFQAVIGYAHAYA